MTEQDTTFGPNAWLVDEMYEQSLADPSSVSESGRDFFADERDGDGAKPPVQTATETAVEEKPARLARRAVVGWKTEVAKQEHRVRGRYPLGPVHAAVRVGAAPPVAVLALAVLASIGPERVLVHEVV